MRRKPLLALILLFAVSAGALWGQKSASAQPVNIGVVAISPGVYQVTASFNTDEGAVSFAATAPASGVMASVTSVTLLSCSHPFGNCTGAVPDTDASATSYNSGAGLANFEPATAAEAVTFVVTVSLSCTSDSSVVIVASQGGSTLTAPLTCGYYSTYAPFVGYPYGGYPFFGMPYFANFLYSNPGYVVDGGLPLLLNGGEPVQGPFIFSNISSYNAAQTILHGPRIGGSGIGAIVMGASGTERNLTRKAIADVKAQMPAYLAAYGLDPSLAPLINQYIDYYASLYGSGQRVSPQQIVQQVMQQIAAYSTAYGGLGGLGGSLTPPRTGEAGLVDTDPNLQFPFVTYYDEAQDIALPEDTGE